MTSVKNEINEILINTVSNLENRLDDSKKVLSGIQEKMDAKVSEAKEYKIQVDSAKENIKRLESEISSLETDLTELKEKYGKKNLLAVIDAGTKEINGEIKKKQDEIQIHKNKIAELTNRARSIKDLLMNFKKDKKIKEERLEELESCTNYYKSRLEEIVKFAEEHENLEDYFIRYEETSEVDNSNVFADIVGVEEETNSDEEVNEFEDNQEEVSLEMTDEIFNDVLNDGEESLIEETDTEEQEEIQLDKINEEDSIEQTNELEENIELDNQENKIEDNEENTRDLEIDNLLSSVKEPNIKTDKILDKEEKIDNLNKAIDEEFANIFGKNINEPISTIDIFGNEYKDGFNEEEIVSKLTDIGLDYYSFKDEDKLNIKNNFNEQTIKDIVNILKDNKIQLDNIYVDGKILSTIAPAELSNIITKLLNAGQSSDAIGYVLDKLPLVDSNLLNSTIANYGDYINNVDIIDIIFKSLKGDM